MFGPCISSRREPKGQRRSDQAHLWMSGDHTVRAGETDDEDVPQRGEEGEEERQRNRWQRLLRCCHDLRPQRDESPAVCHLSHLSLGPFALICLFSLSVRLLLCCWYPLWNRHASAFFMTTWLELHEKKKHSDASASHVLLCTGLFRKFNFRRWGGGRAAICLIKNLARPNPAQCEEKD